MSDTPSPNLHARLRDVADAVRAQAAVSVPKQSIITLEWGIVTMVNDTPPSVNVQPSGNTATSPPSLWSNVSYLSSYQPTEGDNVLVLIDGRDRIVVGTTAQEGNGLQSPVGYGIIGTVPNGTYPGLFIPGGTTYVVGAVGDLSSGTLTMKVQVNGGDVTGLTGLSITTSSGSSPFTCTPYRIPNLTKLRGVASAASSALDLSFSILTATI